MGNKYSFHQPWKCTLCIGNSRPLFAIIAFCLAYQVTLRHWTHFERSEPHTCVTFTWIRFITPVHGLTWKWWRQVFPRQHWKPECSEQVYLGFFHVSVRWLMMMGHFLHHPPTLCNVASLGKSIAAELFDMTIKMTLQHGHLLICNVLHVKHHRVGKKSLRT